MTFIQAALDATKCLTFAVVAHREENSRLRPSSKIRDNHSTLQILAQSHRFQSLRLSAFPEQPRGIKHLLRQFALVSMEWSQDLRRHTFLNRNCKLKLAKLIEHAPIIYELTLGTLERETQRSRESTSSHISIKPSATLSSNRNTCPARAGFPSSIRIPGTGRKPRRSLDQIHCKRSTRRESYLSM
jgi:hypothetical protein